MPKCPYCSKAFGRISSLQSHSAFCAIQHQGKYAKRNSMEDLDVPPIRDMYIVLQKGYPDGIPINANTAEATGISEGETCKFLPYIMMKTADEGNVFVPWLASQTDILADDWQSYEA